MEDKKRRISNHKEKGFVLIATVILMGSLLVIGTSVLSMVDTNLADAFVQQEEVHAVYLAETGIEEAIWYLQNVDITWTGDSPTEHTLNNGTYTISVDNSGAPTYVITVTGYVPALTNARVQKTIEVTGTLL